MKRIGIRIIQMVAPLLFAGVGGGLTSCGDYWEGGDPLPARTMHLPRRVVNMMVGDQYQIPVVFNPDDLTNNAVWWQMQYPDVASVKDNVVTGISEGVTLAYAMSVNDRLQDSCLVNVIPEAYINPRQYPYDMVIYADVTIHGKKYTKDDEEQMIIAAYYETELRGIGKMRQWQGRDYLELRIWSPFEYGDFIDLMCIYRGRALVELFPDQMVFDGMTHGTLSNLYPLVLDDDAEEYTFGYEMGESTYDEDEEQEVVGN